MPDPATELQQVLDARAAQRHRLMQLQQRLDELVPDAPDAARAELATERDDLVARGRALDAQVQQLRAAAAGTATSADAQRLGISLAALEAAAAAALPDLNALACSSHRARAQACQEAGDADGAGLAQAAGAITCERNSAQHQCRYAAADWCPRRVAGALHLAAADRLAAAGAPPDATQLVLGHLRYQQRVPLQPHDSYQVMRAFLERNAATVATKAGVVQLRGTERVLCLHGYTGLGKTVAACYALARLGGVYLTAYDLGGVGQDPAVPNRQQLRQAPVVVVDQVGRAWSQGYVQQVMEWLIDARYDSRTGLTILCGNFLAPADFERDADEIIASRMAKAGKYVLCVGDDLRRGML